MEKRIISIICLLFLALGGLFVCDGITGMYSWDRIDDICVADSECSDSNVCCKFYNENYGVCGKFSVCNGISKVSMEEKQQFSNLNPPSPEVIETALVSSVRAHVEEPMSDYNRNSVVVGLLLVLFAFGVYFFADRHVKSGGYTHNLVKKEKK
ncbi:MAG: hypothetical protein V1914_02095 [archaeon]